MQTISIEMPVRHLVRICIALNETIPSREWEFDQDFEKIKAIVDATEGDTALLSEDDVCTLCKMFSDELDCYSEFLYDLCHGEVFDYEYLTDFVEDLSCICEGLQYLLDNSDFRKNFCELRTELLRQLRAQKRKVGR